MVGDKAGILTTVCGGKDAYHLANWGERVILAAVALEVAWRAPLLSTAPNMVGRGLVEEDKRGKKNCLAAT
jgi:hypothetical protein